MNAQVIKKHLLRWLLILPAAVVVLLITAFLLLQIRWVQHQLLKKYLSRFDAGTTYTTEWSDFYLSWYDQLEVEGLKISDPEHQPVLHAGRLSVNFRFFELLANDQLNLDEISAEHAGLDMAYSGTDSTRKLNVVRMAETFARFLSPGPSSGKPSRPFLISIIRIKDFNLTMRDTASAVPKNQLDPLNFNLQLNQVSAGDFFLHGDTLRVHLTALDGIEKNHQWPILNAEAGINLTANRLDLQPVRFTAGKSSAGDSVTVLLPMADDPEISFDIILHQTNLHPDDIRLIAGTMPLPAHPIELSGRISGTPGNLSIRNLSAATGKTLVEGDFDLDGLPNMSETFIHARIRPTRIHPPDFTFVLPAEALEKMKPFGAFSVRGNFTGFFNDFVANATFQTRLGTIRSDLNFKVDEKNPLLSSYRGNLQLEGFQAGVFSGDTALLQRISLSGKIVGKGLSLETADVILDGNLTKAGVLGYEYRNITSKGRFANQLFIGQVTVDDPGLRMQLEGSIDLREGKDDLQLRGKIDTAAIQNLKWSDMPLGIRTEFRVSTRGLTIDAVKGQIKLRHTALTLEDRRLNLDSILLRAETRPDGRRVLISGSAGSADIHGNFRYDELVNDIREIFSEFYLNASNNKEEIRKYYASKGGQHNDYRIDFLLKFSDLNPLLTFLNTGCTISRDVQLAGHFISGYTTILHAFSAIPKFTWNDREFAENEIDFNGSKLRDSTNVLAMLLISSARQRVTSTISTANLIMEAIWDRDHIDLGLDADQVGYDNAIRLKSEIDFLNDSTRIRILPSQIRLLGKSWTVNPKNHIMIKGEEANIRDLSLDLGDRSMALSGRFSRDPAAVFDVDFRNLTLDLINSIISEKLEGTLNGNLQMRDVYGNPTFQNAFSIKDFKVNGFLAGDLEGTNIWDPEQEAFVLRFTMDRLRQKMIDVTGLYRPSDPESPINLTARFNQAQLKIVEPLVRDIFSNLGGTLSGTFDVHGTLSTPQISGTALVEDGKLTVNYLGTNYLVRGSIRVSNQSIDFQNLEMRDSKNGKGILGGAIHHKDFSNFSLAISSDFKNLQTLATTEKTNDLFYGQAFASGRMTITGPLNKLHISATARTENETKVYIPMQSTTTVERGSFIRFINLRDSASRHTKAPSGSESFDFSMSLNIEVTPEAYSQIIFDKKSGDIIRGYGKGSLKMDIDTKGEFTMFGEYEFEKGFYNFTLGGVINKEFTINKGSKISWYGDPYAGNLSIQAAYRQLASLAPILPQGTNANGTVPASLRRKFPIEVALNLEGAMLSPQISFDINARDLPENLPGDGAEAPIPVKFQFNAFKARLDEQELKKQVFSLVVLRKFSPPDAFTTSGGITNSVSELLSNQLSYWLSQVDQNLEVTLDLGSMDQNAFNISQLRMSYSLMNGRLRITRDGTLFSNQYTQSNVAALAGDWMVDYLLTPDGKLKMKMYSRSNFNMLLSSLNSQSAYTTGMSLTHTQSFNRFSDLLRSENRRQQNNPVNTTDNNQ